MPDPSSSIVAATTEILRASTAGDAGALGKLTPRVYRELRRMANHFLQNERAGFTLQATELVHEVYLRLVDVKQVEWQDKAHFFAVAATLMRRILLDRARRRLAAKRGKKPKLVGLEEAGEVSLKRARELVALDDALSALAEMDARKARTIELRFFGGLSIKETAEVLQVSPETVMRDWKFSRAWLLTELGSLPEVSS
jgi:RNA polymerase sigma factor (TIGR02999 family)